MKQISRFVAYALVLGLAGSASATSYIKTINVSSCRTVPDSSRQDEMQFTSDGDGVTLSGFGGTQTVKLICDLQIPATATQLDTIWLDYSAPSGSMGISMSVYRTWDTHSGFIYTHNTNLDGSCTASSTSGSNIGFCTVTSNQTLATNGTTTSNYDYAAYALLTFTTGELTGGGTAYRIEYQYEAP